MACTQKMRDVLESFLRQFSDCLWLNHEHFAPFPFLNCDKFFAKRSVASGVFAKMENAGGALGHDCSLSSYLGIRLVSGRNRASQALCLPESLIALVTSEIHFTTGKAQAAQPANKYSFLSGGFVDIGWR
jgi:hypothetical protein